MRIIRIATITLAVTMVILPKLAFADETSNTETNTDTTLLYFGNLMSPDTDSNQIRDEILAAVAKHLPAQTPVEIQNAAILAMWKEKQTDKWSNLPKGSFQVNASEYTASADECDNDKGITASGIKVGENRTIACPPEFPFGAKIKIDTMGTFICEDRGGAIKGNHIDIYVKTKDEAFAFGRQDLMAEVVE